MIDRTFFIMVFKWHLNTRPKMSKKSGFQMATGPKFSFFLSKNKLPKHLFFERFLYSNVRYLGPQCTVEARIPNEGNPTHSKSDRFEVRFLIVKFKMAAIVFGFQMHGFLTVIYLDRFKEN